MTMMPRKTWSISADRLQQRIVRGVGEAEQQADLGDGVADNADDDDATDPAHGVGGGQVGDVQQAEAVVDGGEHHARDAEQCLAQRDGVDDREQDQPRQRVAAEGGCGDQVPDGEEAEHGQQFEEQADGHEGYAAEQDERGGEAATWGLDFALLGAGLAVFDGGGAGRRWGPCWRAPGWGGGPSGGSPMRRRSQPAGRRRGARRCRAGCSRAQGAVAMTFSQLHSRGTLRAALTVAMASVATWLRKPDAPTRIWAPRLSGATRMVAGGLAAGAGVAAGAGAAAGCGGRGGPGAGAGAGVGPVRPGAWCGRWLPGS